MESDIQTVLVNEAQIKTRVEELGNDISEKYREEELVLIWVQHGALLFTADLIRNISIPLRLDCIRVSSYKGTTTPVTDPQILQSLNLDIEGHSVLLVDDILDTGKTLQRVVKELEKNRPKSIETCVLLDKQTERPIVRPCDYVGFEIADQFVVGYGLDFAERYRHLPYIGVLKPELQNPPEWV
ncbi:MAG: hypoxanthine phosphoribosyltransferase [Opitutales bacterium]|nr:hypoxanthine phosphoribosyltransferase [Opitutales bacterium]